MYHILRKEINSFLHSLVGYVVMTVFLTGVGLFTWVFPGNIPDSGFATLDPLFSLAPYLYLFLIPAVTMRMFAEEKKAGTMELLFTRPLTDWQIVLGKYGAALVLVLLALLPTVLYYWAVWSLGLPPGNLDTAGIVGSYLGLILLAATFNAIGIFCSSLTDNQIVSFILAVFGCFVLYDGFGLVASVGVWSQYAYTITRWGIDHHYAAMSRGVIDSRNLLYFGSIILFLLTGTRMVLGSRKWQ